MSDGSPIKAARIRELNDQLRCKAIGGRIVITRGIQALGADDLRSVLLAVARFDDFSEDVESRWRAVSHYWGRFRHPALRTGRASFPASGSLCAAYGLRVGPMVAMAR
jgi:hypothetical protein